MNKWLALGLGTVAVVAAVLLMLAGHAALGVMALVGGAGFDLLFVKAIFDERKPAGRP